jgi:hypothetical protein
MEAFENARQCHRTDLSSQGRLGVIRLSYCQLSELRATRIAMIVNTRARRRARLKREALAIASRAGYALAMGATALIIWFFIVVFFQLGA